MASEAVLREIAKDSGIPFSKAKIAANVLSAGINHCLRQGLITLECDEDDKGREFVEEFMVAKRLAVIKVRTSGHDELSIAVSVPVVGGKCNLVPNPMGRLTRDLDLVCSCWLERKTGKFIQGVLTCRSRRKAWNKALAEKRIKPVGYGISTKFFF